VRRVSERRVDLLVPGPEGGWLARALEQAGMVTFRREPGQPPTPRVGVVVVALSLEPGRSPRESFEAQLAQAREGLPPETPLVALLPVDAQLDEGLRALAQGVYPRPVPVARLVHKIEALLDMAQGGAPRPSWSPSAPPVVDAPVGKRPAPVVAPPADDGARERTMRLDDPELSTASRGAPPPKRRSSRPPSSSSGGDYDASSQVSGLIENTQPVAELSPWLHKMLSDCDRRMFPAAPPLDLRFPAGDDGPLELVPRALLDVLGVPVDPAPNDAFDGHTFAGELPWALQSLPGKRHSEWPRLESSVSGAGSSPGRPATGSAGGQEQRAGSHVGSQPGSPAGSQPGSHEGSQPGSQPSVRESDVPASTREVVLPVAPRRDAVPREGAVESVIARRPEGDSRRPEGDSRRPDPDTRRQSRIPDRRRTSMPPAPSSPPQGLGSSPPGAAGLYETAVEVPGYPSRPSPPVLSVGTPTADARGRWGTLAPDAWLGFALALRGLDGEQRVSLRTERDGVLLVVRAGEVLAPFEADGVPESAARLDESSVGDPLAALQRLRRGRHTARERVIAVLTPAWHGQPPSGGTARVGVDPELVFEVYDVPAGEPASEGWPLGSLVALMLEALAGWVSVAWLRVHWQADLAQVLLVHPSAADWASRLGIDGLWVEWLRACEGRSLDALLDALPDSEGLPCALLALVGVGAIAFVAAPPDAQPVPPILELRARARRLIEGAYAATRNVDYFTLLGVRPSASARAVERACAACTAPLLGLDLETLGLGELAPLRSDVLECYAEAQRALRDDDARARYARALGLVAGA
jgi:hypothetical protein